MANVILKQEGDTVSIVMSSQVDMETVHKDSDYNIVDEQSLPKDREFRDAWTIDGSIDLNKAKEIWRNKIRQQRNAKLGQLDIQWMKAMESGNIKKASAIANKKQTLRDITDREELTKASTIEELKSFWPDELKG